LVEDCEDSYEMYSSLLAEYGYRVFGADNGADAVTLAHELQPDLIIMDIALPVMDGIEATRELKANPSTAKIPILALTGYVQSHYTESAQSAGCVEVLLKPCRIDQLLSRVSELAGKAVLRIE
jgi:CheY-like chemotaxis protein